MPDRRRCRLDELLVRRGLFATRAQARSAIIVGEVRVGDATVTKPGSLVDGEDAVTVAERRRYVSRGGDKLEHALGVMGIDVTGADACDLGSSTGGFVDCLLAHGARAVAAVDVGYGQLAWKLRNDPRVTVIERQNARELTCERLPFAPSFVTADLSFISLTVALGPVLDCARPDCRGLALVKPQFEAGREHVGKGGVVRDPSVQRQALEKVSAWLRSRGMVVLGMTDSGYPGPKGNVEYFISFCAALSPAAVHATEPAAEARRAVEVAHA